jgi:peptide subunit release factor RF-3
LRDVPIITFANKLDREGRDPFDLLDEIEHSLALDVTPASWPIGMGRDFLGSYDLFADALLLFERGVHDPKLPRPSPKAPRQIARGGRDGARPPSAASCLTKVNSVLICHPEGLVCEPSG